MSHCTTLVSTPLGTLAVHDGGGALTAVDFPERAAASTGPFGETALLREARRQLQAYFAGELREFDVPLAPHGTEFQRRVWDQLRAIRWGQTRSYGWVAAQLGLPPSASRAVGAANGANPLPIVIPRHRVIGADGTLTGYGGGLHRKALLLRLEGVVTSGDQGRLF